MKTSTVAALAAAFIFGTAGFLVAAKAAAKRPESIPEMMQQLRAVRQGGPDMQSQLEAVSHSSDPQAVGFMIQVLHDTSADSGWRREAFFHVAGTGGTAGVNAVKQARRRVGARKPWFDSIDLANLPGYAIQGLKKVGSNTWILFQSEALGNSSDLFIVEEQGRKWGRPLFTGAWSQRTFRTEAPKSFRGTSMAKILAGAWFQMFVNDPIIRRDSDGDGLTDVVEARLGTDPKKADTDGDGLPDAIDPCPNAAPRKLGDAEKIIAACVEAEFFGGDLDAPALVEGGEVKPFEFYGYPSTLLWNNSRPSALDSVYGGGVQVISFIQPDYDPINNGARHKYFIRYSSDHKTARTIISRYSGGLNGDGTEVRLNKIGGDWFVDEFTERWVS